ncbi:MAG: ribosome small subunit-dependent GTPase A [Armatimonadia bacterium]|nr:ribosome small subunit-dependent GTPase A [Armatimonadia bacterium]
MTQHQKQLLQEKLSQLDQAERRKLYKRAASMRKQSKHTARPKRRERNPDEGNGGWTPKRSQESLDRWALQILQDEAPEWGMEETDEMAGPEGLVAAVEQGRCAVQLNDGASVAAILRSELASEQQSRLAVGDRVILGEAHAGEAVVAKVLPRSTTLSRPDPHHGHIERVIAANVESAVIVVSLIAPPLHPAFIDRVLVAVNRGGSNPIIACNKVDLAEDDDARSRELARLDPYRDIGIPVVACSAHTGEGVDLLLDLIAGQLCVFMGHSGVGKSSLLNALMPDLGLVTNEVRSADGKGRHTTTTSCLYDLRRGARVIDTPGVREFGLGDIGAADLLAAFPEMEPYVPACRFRNCTHVHEPGCAVRGAVEEGLIDGDRYGSFRKLSGGG